MRFQNERTRPFMLGIAAASLLVAAASPSPRLAGAASGSPPAKQPPAVTLAAALGRSPSSRQDAKPLLIKIDYGAAGVASGQRPPLNIALVLDRSGSMAEQGKLRYTLDAARVVVENLSDQDYVSIVAYNDRTTVLSPSGRAVNRKFLAHRLDEVTAEGWTDLSAGLLEGIAQIARTSAAGQSRHVLLLTDGLANRGVIDQAGLRRIAAAAQTQGIEVSTFGCGTEFDGKLLKAVAESGAGRYTYVRTAEQIPTAFLEELHGFLQVVAQNVRLDLTLGPGAELGHVYGVLPGTPSPRSFQLGNLRAGERGLLVAELAPGEPGTAVELKARLTFDDVAAGRRGSIEVRARSEPGAERPDVTLYGEVLEALDRAIEAVEGEDQARAAAARADYARVYERARAYAIETHDQELLNQTFLLKHFIGELDESESEGRLHEHDQAAFTKEAEYQRYLLLHHHAGQ